MKFVIAALLGLAAATDGSECDKDGKCPADHCCANLTGGDPEASAAMKGAADAAAKAKVTEAFDKNIESNSGGKGGVCFNNKAAAKGSWTVAGQKFEASEPDFNGAVLEWACRGAPPKKEEKKEPKKEEKKEEKKKEEKKEEKKKEEKKGDAKEGERGTNKEGEACNHKEKGKGCVEKMCCAKATSVDFSGIENAEMKKTMEAAYEAGKAKAEEKGDGTCLPDDKTEYTDEKSKIKATYECGATALAATAMVVLSAAVNM